ncbi:hypothetical protein Acr_09g0000480 [Actinidia rufa]|uniref:Uncharacterized protein n=1 Tax=Actinidia rufa TaxID=165716 RepID=A0A7J0F4J3_9ERIC|nr:hypothetical protein Acr_09g0000480 [Actinidia rufa]
MSELSEVLQERSIHHLYGYLLALSYGFADAGVMVFEAAVPALDLVVLSLMLYTLASSHGWLVDPVSALMPRILIKLTIIRGGACCCLAGEPHPSYFCLAAAAGSC